MGVPAGLAKSAPPCGARGSLLKTLRTPNPETTAPSIGTMNGPRHSGERVTVRNTRPSSARSRAMRAWALLGGVTKRGSTRRVRVGNSFASTFIVSVRDDLAACRRSRRDGDRHVAGRHVEIDPDQRAPHAVVAAERVHGPSEGRDRHRAQRLAGDEIETHDFAGLHGPRVYRDLERIGLKASAAERQRDQDGVEPPAERHGT